MNNNKNLFIYIILTLSFSIAFLAFLQFYNKSKNVLIKENGSDIGYGNGMQSRRGWEYERIKDPNIGQLPENIFIKEQIYASKLPNDLNKKVKSSIWSLRGPYNVGGRTRAAALDIADNNIIIAGGVSGGMWRSTDNGKVWTKTTLPNQLHSVSCLTQDKRVGKTNIWYYGTGEAYGNSAAANGAFFYGDGIYKSIDNGITWSPLEYTVSNTPKDFNDFDLIWNIVADHTNNVNDVVYASTLKTVYKSTNGGDTWAKVIGGETGSLGYYTDIAIDNNGVLYATFDSDSPSKGIWRSVDGDNWVNITPQNFASVFKRIVIGVCKSEPNKVYFLGVTPGSGKKTKLYTGEEEWNSLWKYEYVSGDGTEAGGTWTDLSENIPGSGDVSSFDNFYAQSSYNLVISVKPDDANVVFIGGTNLYRSKDGFSSKNNTVQVGGYGINTSGNFWGYYPNHHPDQHVVHFSTVNPNILLSGHDGGLNITSNCLDSLIVWDTLNNGYYTTQPYTVAIDENTTDNRIISGLQDNGTYFTNNKNITSYWNLSFNGDGAYCHIVNDSVYYVSKQNGRIYKVLLDNEGVRKASREIDPTGGSGYIFVNPFAVDPNNSNIMYLCAGNHLWRNDSLNSIDINNTQGTLSKGWFKYTDSVNINYTVTSVSVSKNPANIVYYGTSNRRVYKINDANNGDAEHIDITGYYFPVDGYVNSIAVNPNDANEVIVVFSNYGVYSLFYSKDGGSNWIKIGGNLEEYLGGGGSGPSCRWASIMPFGDKTLYFVGTSVGLFCLDTIAAHSSSFTPIWTKVGVNTIGNVVVDMIKTRANDSLIVVATHANGIYSAKINSVDELLGFNKLSDKIWNFNVYPNPSSNNLNISFDLVDKENISISIYDIKGNLVFKENNEFNVGKNYYKFNISNLKNGVYYCSIKGEKYNSTKKFIVLN